MLTLNEKEITAKSEKLQRDKKTVNKWYGLNTTKKLGCISCLFHKYQPKTLNEFFNEYLNDSEDGKSVPYLIMVSDMLGEKDGNRYTKEEYYNFILQKIFVDTFNGLNKEKELKDFIEKKGFTTKEPSRNEDIKYGIDLLVYKDGNLKYLVQSKPNTFFKGNGNESLINDRKKALEKQRKAEKAFNAKVIYCIYDRNTNKWKKNKNGGIAFKLDSLISNDGRIKNNIN